MSNERRHRRATTTTKALEYQLLACCEAGVEAMVVADDEGLPLALSGDIDACEEVAARMTLVGRKIDAFDGTLLGAGHQWQVQMRKIAVLGTELLVCAVGGTADARDKQISRGAAGALRILQAA